jgi:hypothetical protein
MDMPAGGDGAAMRQLYAQQDWSRLAQVAERRVQQQPQDGDAWCFWGIGELMQLKGGPDKLLQASLLGQAEAGLWLGMLQEFSTHPPGTVPVTDFPAQIELARLRRSPYLDYPQEVHIETFAKCNAACTFCPYPTMERQGDRMPDELIDKIIEDLTQIPQQLPFSIAPFKVNEPFLDKRIFAVCAKLNARLPNAQLRLFSNGSSLTERIVEKSAAIGNVIHLWISLNEYEAEPYAKLMSLPLDRTLAKLDTLHEMVSRGRYPHPVTISRVTDGSERDQGFLAFVRQRYPAFRPFMIGEGNWSGQVQARSERRVPGTGCFRWYEISIMASGKVALCCMDGEGKHVIGDVNTQSVLEIYNSPGYRKMRQFTFLRKAAAAPCDTCVYF